MAGFGDFREVERKQAASSKKTTSKKKTTKNTKKTTSKKKTTKSTAKTAAKKTTTKTTKATRAKQAAALLNPAQFRENARTKSNPLKEAAAQGYAKLSQQGQKKNDLNVITQKHKDRLSVLATPKVVGATQSEINNRARRAALKEWKDNKDKVNSLKSQNREAKDAVRVVVNTPYVLGKKAMQGLYSGANSALDGMAMFGASKFNEFLNRSLDDDTQNKIANIVGKKDKETMQSAIENYAANYSDQLPTARRANQLGDDAAERLNQLNGPLKTGLEKVGDFSSMAGRMLPAVVAARFNPGLASGMLGISYGGEAASQAYENGATFDEALTTGAIKGVKGVTIDRALGGIAGVGRGTFDNAIRLGSGSRVLDVAKRLAGEGAEEVVDTATDPLVDRAVYNPDAPWATFKELAEAGAAGVAVGAMYQIPSLAMSAARNSSIPETNNEPTAPIPPPTTGAIEANTDVNTEPTAEDSSVITDDVEYYTDNSHKAPRRKKKKKYTSGGSGFTYEDMDSDSGVILGNTPGFSEDANTDSDENLANVSARTERQRRSVRQFMQDTKDVLERELVNSGYAVERLADTYDNQTLKHRYNNVKQSTRTVESMVTQNQSDFDGRNVGKGLDDIFKDIRKEGDDYYNKFQTYMFDMHNIYRMREGKPVFGDAKTAELSIREAHDILSKHPEFHKYAQDVYRYYDNLLDYRVEAGLISRKFANELQRMYPFYVGTYRQAFGANGIRSVGNTIDTAVGSNLDLLPLHEQMVNQTSAVVHNAKLNKFLNELYETLPDTQIQVEEGDADYDVDAESIETSPVDIQGNVITFYRNGERVRMTVDDGIAFGIRELAPKTHNAIYNAAQQLNKAFKGLITTYQPLFVITNGLRDVQDGALYSKNTVGFAKKYPVAWAGIVSGSEQFRIYQSLGGFGSSFFNDPTSYNFREHSKARKYTLDQIEKANYMVEQAPRFAEFLNVLSGIKKSRGDGSGLSEDLSEFSSDERQQALYAAADITVNFGRSGRITQWLNASAVPFMNPAIQGTSKNLRTITDGVRQNQGHRGVQTAIVTKNIGTLVLKAAILGVGGRMLGELLWGDDDEYQEMNERDKELNYIIKDPTDGNILSGGTGWIKIPQGRAIAFTNSFMRRLKNTAKATYNTATGNIGGNVLDNVANEWKGFGETAANTVAPMNPLESNFYLPASKVIGQGTDRNNSKTWFGNDIEGREFENAPVDQRYDERTTSTSKALSGLNVFGKTLGERTGLSPQELDYLGNSYLGSIWKFGSPFLTPYAEDNAVKQKFTIDPVTQNRLSGDFYDAKQKAAYEAYGQTETVSNLMKSYYTTMANEVGDINDEIYEIQTSSMSNEEKLSKVRELKDQINDIYRNAITHSAEYQKAAERNLNQFGDYDTAKIYTNKDVFGAEYALEKHSKDTYNKAKNCFDVGISYDDYFSAYMENKNINKTESTYKGENAYKARSYILSMGLDGEKPLILANNIGVLDDSVLTEARRVYTEADIPYGDFFAAYTNVRNIENQKAAYSGENSYKSRQHILGLGISGEKKVVLANSLGLLTNDRLTEARKAYEEAGIGYNDYLALYTGVMNLSKKLSAEGVSKDNSVIEQRLFIAANQNLTAEQKTYIDNLIVNDDEYRPNDLPADYTGDKYTFMLSTFSEKAGTLIEPAKALGISSKDLYVAYRNISKMQTDKDENGDTITGTKKSKTMAYIDSLNLSNEAKDYLFSEVGGFAGEPNWGNINEGKQGKDIATFSESDLVVDSEGNPIGGESYTSSASSTSSTPVLTYEEPNNPGFGDFRMLERVLAQGDNSQETTQTTQTAATAQEEEVQEEEPTQEFVGVTEANGGFTPEIINAAMLSQTKTGIPAALVLAQWAEETGFGKSMPKGSNNAFGVKGGGSWTGPTVYGNNSEGTDPAIYRVYNSIEESIADHSEVLHNGLYDIDGLDVSDTDGWINALDGIYAKNPEYANNLRKLVNQYDLNQYTEMAKQYSGGGTSSTQSAAEQPTTVAAVDVSTFNTGNPFGNPGKGYETGYHGGVDFGVPIGTAVNAARDGVVVYAKDSGGAWGNRIVVDMGDGMYYAYNHLSSIGVEPGDTVTAGQTVARSGDTGRTYGAHLDVEVYNGDYSDLYNRIDPMPYFGWDGSSGGKIVYTGDDGSYQAKSGGGSSGSSGGSSSGRSSGSTSSGSSGSTGSSGSSSNGSSGAAFSSVPSADYSTLYRSRYSRAGNNLSQDFYQPLINQYYGTNGSGASQGTQNSVNYTAQGKVVYAAPDNGVNRLVIDNGDGTYTSYTNLPTMPLKMGDIADPAILEELAANPNVEVEVVQGSFLVNERGA